MKEILEGFWTKKSVWLKEREGVGVSAEDLRTRKRGSLLQI